MAKILVEESSLSEAIDLLKKIDNRVLELTNEVEALRLILHEKNMIDDKFVSLSEAAKMLGKSYQQCGRYVKSGLLDARQAKTGATYEISMRTIEEFKKRKKKIY